MLFQHLPTYRLQKWLLQTNVYNLYGCPSGCLLYTTIAQRLNALIKTLDQYLEVLEMQLGLYSTSWK